MDSAIGDSVSWPSAIHPDRISITKLYISNDLNNCLVAFGLNWENFWIELQIVMVLYSKGSEIQLTRFRTVEI